MDAAAVESNPTDLLPGSRRYPRARRVGIHLSAPFAQTARLVLKVSLNLGANLSLSLFGLDHGKRTRAAALAAERKALINQFGVPAAQFDFPTNGSGTPDSQASPRALVKMLRAMSKTRVAGAYRRALPVMGVDGSLAHTGTTLAGRGRVLAKPGTTVLVGPSGGLELKAQNLAGYIDAKSGRRLAYALMVNDVGPISDIERDVGRVFEDEARISNLIYKAF